MALKLQQIRQASSCKHLNTLNLHPPQKVFPSYRNSGITKQTIHLLISILFGRKGHSELKTQVLVVSCFQSSPPTAKSQKDRAHLEWTAHYPRMEVIIPIRTLRATNSDSAIGIA